MRNLTFVRHKVKHYPHLWLKVKTRSPPTHADGVSHPEIGHFGQKLGFQVAAFPFEKLPCSKELLRKFFARAFSSVPSRVRPLSPLFLVRNSAFWQVAQNRQDQAFLPGPVWNWCFYLTSRSSPVATSNTKPRTWSRFGMNGLFLIRAIDCRMSVSRSAKASADQSGF